MNNSLQEQKKRSIFCNQLKELTGESSIALLHKAYHDCSGSLRPAIKYLGNFKSKNLSERMPDYTGRTLSRQKGPSVSALNQTPMEMDSPMTGRVSTRNDHKAGTLGGGNPVIDLTEGFSSEDSELQQAIKLSMECNMSSPGHIDLCNTPLKSTTEHRSSNDKKSRKGVKFASDPNLRKRQSQDWPAGLKNVGNTCWFSAVIQSLFNLPVFKSLILNHKIPDEELPPPQSERYRNILFFKELKNLFALLVSSHQSYIDPSKCVDQLHARFVSNEKCQQQDVSEFTHKLLDWLEDALGHRSENSSQSPTENIVESPMEVDHSESSDVFNNENKNLMVDLFYGEYKAHGINNGNSFTKPQKFGLFPLYVNGVSDLHDSLEFTTRDFMHLDPKKDMAQEHWFTKLPPVLIFELSRFHFNQKSGATEKIHSRFDFPNVLYMDRYMESNAGRTRQSREDCAGLVSHLNIMKEELKKRRKMMLGEKTYSIQDVLKCCTEIAASKRKRYIESKHNLPSSKRIRNSSSEEMPTVESDKDVGGAGDGGGCSLQEMESDDDSEVKNTIVVEQCLKSWMEELEQEKEGLRDDINDIQKRIDTTYDDPALKKHPYVLHSVLVHQGLAVAGHYWAYVRDHQNSKWLKFNDTAVKESNWDELIKDSVGGSGTGITSAYCLMYIDRNRQELLMGTSGGEKALSSDVELKSLIEKHNMEFENELDDWELEQAKILSLIMTRDISAEGTESSDVSDDKLESQEMREETHSDPVPVRERKESLSLSPQWNGSGCKDAIEKYQNLNDTRTADEILDQVVKEEWDRLRKVEKDYFMDTNVQLEHVVIYMFRNKAPRKVIERTLLEQFADDGMSYDQRSTEIMKCAKKKLQSLSPEDRNDDEYQMWLKNYSIFIKATCFLVQGIELIQDGKHADALRYLAYVKTENDKMIWTTLIDQEFDYRIADWDEAVRAITRCIRHLHNEAFDKVQFLSPEDNETSAFDGINILIDSIVPWIHVLTENNQTKLLERIKTDWGCLDVSSEKVREKLEYALHALMEPPTQLETIAEFHAPVLIRPQNSHELCERYNKAMLAYKSRPKTGSSASEKQTVWC